MLPGTGPKRGIQVHMVYGGVIQGKGSMGGNHEALSKDVASSEVQPWFIPWRALPHIATTGLGQWRRPSILPNQAITATGSARVRETTPFSPGKFSGEQGSCTPVATKTPVN